MIEGEMIEKFRDNSLPLYPYDGRSSYLIDKFYIFGYNYLTIKKYVINEPPDIYNEKIPLKTLIPFQLEEEPSILTEITNDYNKQIILSDLIQKRIFPNKVNFYFRIEIDENKPIRKNTAPININYNQFEKIDFSEERTGIPMSTRNVFSNIFVNDNDSRKCQNGFAYTFYRKFYKEKFFKNKKCTFYVPYTFCIISEFPFYQSFEHLFRCIRRMFSQDLIYIPLEIILYKIVKITPSPINSDVILDLESICNQDKIFNNNEKEGIKKGLSAEINHELNLDKNNKTEFDNFLGEFENIEKKPINKIKYKYLSGYPMVQYNLAKVLFKTKPLTQNKSLFKPKAETEVLSLSIEKIISIFLLTFLEEDLIIFSKEIEYLTLFLQSFVNFNYPYNDMHYYFSSGAISLETFQNGTNKFISPVQTNMIGVHNQFVPEYLTNNCNLSSHTVIDLDQGEIITDRSDEEIIKIIEFINKICSNEPCEKRLKETIIYQAVVNLYKRLDKASQKKKVYSEGNFIHFTDDPNKDNIENLNKDIQEAFYDFIIKISLYFYDNTIILENGKSNKQNNKNKKNNFYGLAFDKSYEKNGKYLEEEELILTKTTNAMKFEGSFCSFAIYHEPTDLFAIPLIFTEEFISFISNKRNRINTPNIKYFELIDQLYLPKKDNKTKIINFNSDINNFLNNYKNNLSEEIDKDEKEFNDDDFSLIKIVKQNENKILKYQTYELDDNILIKYNNIFFDSSKNKNLDLIEEKNEEVINELKKINTLKIETILEKFCLNNKVLSNTELCCANSWWNLPFHLI